MRNRMIAAALLASTLIGATFVACGDDSTDDAAPSAAAATPTIAPDPTEDALVDALGALQQLTLNVQEVPDGFDLRSSQAVSKSQVVTANAGIPALAQAIDGSTLQGAWATFYRRDQPETGLSSIVYLYPAVGGGAALVDAIADVSTETYAGATSVERLQSEPIGDRSQMMLYTLPGARIIELTWAQGRYASQIILRHAGEEGDPGDAALLTSLARQQNGRIAQAP